MATGTMSDGKLIFDIGMHKGEDTDFYLRKGFRVVGFEAHPALAQECRDRFAGEIAANRLTIVEGAIGKPETVGRTITFYANDDISVWGTTLPEWSARNERLMTTSRVLSVEVIDFAACIASLGTPYYMKVDIEGSDMVCIEALQSQPERPPYFSLESSKTSYRAVCHEIDMLEAMGYRCFKAVQQATVHKVSLPATQSEGQTIAYSFPKGSSGPFGADLPGDWLSAGEIKQAYRAIFRSYALFGDDSLAQCSRVGRGLLTKLRELTRRPLPGWYDTHAWQGRSA